MKIFKIFFLLILLNLLFACSKDELKKSVIEVENEVDSLKDELITKV